MSTDEDAAVFAPQSVRDGARILRFLGHRVAEASSARPGVQRWSEIVVYRLPSGAWLCQRVGRSTVAHRPECRFVTWHMPPWLEAGEEARVRRTPCIECQPLVGDRMDPHTRLESQRYTVLQASDVAQLTNLLVANRDRVPGIITSLLEQLVP